VRRPGAQGVTRLVRSDNSAVSNGRFSLRIISITLSLVLSGGQAYVQNSDQQGSMLERPNWRESSLTVDGLTRWHRVYVPKALPEGAPVVLLLHGGLQSMRTIFAPRAGGTKEWADLAESESFLLVVPNGINEGSGDAGGDSQGWNDGRMLDSRRRADDVKFIGNLLDRIGRDYSIDRTRIYVTGASNGGMMTYRLLMEAPERFAAGVAFIANLPASSPVIRKPALPTPLMIANGTEDKVIKWAGGEILNGFGFVRSVEATVDWWVEANHARRSKPVREQLPDTEPSDGCSVLRTTYPAEKHGALVVLYALEGAGHAMPSRKHARGRACREIEGARLAWDFMKDHRRDIARASVPAR
jgi:polyhydroxybutyrate depolymerase